jgi:hypothetical protein
MSRHRNIRGLAKDWSEFDGSYVCTLTCTDGLDDDYDDYSEEDDDEGIASLIDQVRQVLGYHSFVYFNTVPHILTQRSNLYF